MAKKEEKKISIFGEAKVKSSGSKPKDDKEVVYIDGLESKLLELQFLKAQIADLEAQLVGVTDEIKTISKEKFVELYQTNKSNPNTFLIKDGEGCVMVIPTDRYISIKDEDRVNQLMEDYGDDVITIDEKYYFNPQVLERNMSAIEKLIMDAKTISDDDKRNLLVKEVKYSISKGYIDKLAVYGNKIETVIDDIQPIITLKNCGGKMEEGGELGSDFIATIYENGGGVEKYELVENKDGSYSVLNKETNMFVDRDFSSKQSAEYFINEKKSQMKTFGKESYFANGGGVGSKVRMRLQDEDGFDEYLEEINFNFNEIEFEDSDIIIVSKNIADKFENDGVAYVLMGNELYKNGGGVGKTYGELYNKIVLAVMKDIKVSREKAEDIVNKNEGWLTDMIEYEGETNVTFLADQITTTDEGLYANGGGVGFKIGDNVSTTKFDNGKVVNVYTFNKDEIINGKNLKKGETLYEVKNLELGDSDSYVFFENDLEKKFEQGGFLGGIFGGGRTYKKGLAYKLDRAKHNKSEDWEVPLKNRKRYANGGGVGVGSYKNHKIGDMVEVWQFGGGSKIKKIVGFEDKEHNHYILEDEKGNKSYTPKKYIANLSGEFPFMNEYANGGGVEDYNYYGSMTDESVVMQNCSNGEIHCDILEEIIGTKPNYPYQQVGSIRLQKCYLRPYYKICK